MSSHALPHAAAFSPSLTEQERVIIQEELDILARLREHLAGYNPPSRGANYDEALLELRDSLGEAREDDIAQIVEQMSNLASLSSQLQRDEEARQPLDPDSPYFGHLRLRQEGRVRDVLLGNRTQVAGQIPYPIIDWRHAPISRVFYVYREGDEYEEEIGGRQVEGSILARRMLLILKGRLVRIECALGVFTLVRRHWVRVDEPAPTLVGGAGTALRPSSVEPLRLGVAHPELLRGDKHLQAITGLIDPEQFELITHPESGIVVIDGGAGSGKTTIALHRMAYLTYRSPQRFAAQNMLAVVYGKALATYISHLLPALGVRGVRIEVFEELASALRRQHYPTLVASYAAATPSAVVRFKQHPAAHALLEQRVAEHAGELRETFAEALGDAPCTERVLGAWDGLAGVPLAPRLEQFAGWVLRRRRLPGVGAFGEDWLAAQRLKNELAERWPEIQQPHKLALSLWEGAFVSLERLAEAMAHLAPGEFSTDQLEEVRDWALRYYGEAEDYRLWQAERKEAEHDAAEKDGGEEEPPAAPPRMDREDDTLLLLLHVLVVGPLRSRKRRPLRFQHLMVDEAQDLGPLDLRVLIALTAEPRSITLAGDTDQRMILHNRFTRWEEVLGHLELESTAISPLRIGYRSTEEIMRFAGAVLGSLASERPWIPTRKGVPVLLLRFTDAGQAVATLADALGGLMRREPAASVALIARYPAQADVYHQGLVNAELPSVRRVRDQDFSFRPGIEVTDVTQTKGLEFDYVVLLDADQATYPDDAASRYLLHIAATRAAHQLWLVVCRQPSPLLPTDLPTHML